MWTCRALLTFREDLSKPETQPSRDSTEKDLAIGIIHKVISLFGHDLLDVARAVAGLDSPTWVRQFFVSFR